ncbi:MAG: hypothetical protein Q9214_000277 [Letrouitia sp. 1 TL-2023]
MAEVYIGSERRADGLLQKDIDMLLRPPAENSAIYSQALQVLDSLRTSPACNRLAASDLISWCQFIESPSPASEAFLEDLRSTYAARLAICEISDAGLPIPSNCDTFAFKVDRNKKRSMRKSQINQEKNHRIDDKRQLSLCLQALESRPQHWTSYSNNRQNAMIMCQAARIDIEKDNLIKLYSLMTETSSQANSALSQAVRDINDGLMQRKQFMLMVNSLQGKLVKDLESSTSAMKTYFNEMMENLSAVVQGAATKMTSVLKDSQNNVKNLNNALRMSNAESRDLSENIGRMLEQALEGSRELAAAQTQQWDKQRAVAADISGLQVSLQAMKESEVAVLATAFQGINNQLKTSNDLVHLLSSQQDAMGQVCSLVIIILQLLIGSTQRIGKLNASFATLETTAAALRLAQALHAEEQTLHAEEQKRQYDEMQTDLLIVKALLADVTASATGLQIIKSLSSTSLLNWSWAVVALFVLYQLKPRWASYAVATLGIYH